MARINIPGCKTHKKMRDTECSECFNAVFDGMRLESPDRRRMKAVYRSTTLLGLFNLQGEAEKYLRENSSLRMVEDYNYQYRIVPVIVTIELYKKEK